MAIIRVKHIKRVRTRRGGGEYFYHTVTGEPLPQDPEARRRRALAISRRSPRQAQKRRSLTPKKPSVPAAKPNAPSTAMVRRDSMRDAPLRTLAA